MASITVNVHTQQQFDQYGRPITGCAPCDGGCACEAGTPGCEHYGCWGVMSDEVAYSCPAVAAHRAARLARQRSRNTN